MISDEEKQKGDVGLQPYCDYFRVAGGALLLLYIVLSQGAFVVGQVSSNYWLASAILNPNIDSGLLVGVYASISLCSGAFVYGRARLVVLLSLRASKAFFSGMINSIFRAPMAFFDTTHVGRVLIQVRKYLPRCFYSNNFKFWAWNLLLDSNQKPLCLCRHLQIWVC